VVVAGRRFGKTFLAVPELLRMAWGPDREAWYVAPTYRQAKQIVWRKLKRLAAPWTAGKPNESDLSIDLRWGSRIALRGADNYDSLRGVGLNGLVLDEYADIAEEAWTEALRPMLSDRLGSALFIGTPKGRNHFFRLYQKARAAEDWGAYQFTTLDGGNVLPSEIEAAREDLDERTFRQEYEASFENLFAGVAYYCFAPGIHAAKKIEYDPHFPLCWSLDFNIDPACSVIGQVIDTTTRDQAMLGRQTSEIRILDELVLPDTRTIEACDAFLKRITERGWLKEGRTLTVYVFGDATGASGHSSSLKTDWQTVREFLQHVPEIKAAFYVPQANPPVRDRITAVNSTLRSQSGEARMKIDPRCRELQKDFEAVCWKRDAAGNALNDIAKNDPKRTHISDALGYLVWHYRPLREWGGPRSTVIV